MKWNYAVTWESMTSVPLTIKGQVDASSFAVAARRSVQDATKQVSKGGKRNVCSMLVLLDRASKLPLEDPEDAYSELVQEKDLEVEGE